MADWNNFLIAVDEMDSSLRAVRYVGKLAGSIDKISICLLHVYPVPPPDFEMKGGILENYQAQRVTKAENIFGRCLEILTDADFNTETIRCITRMAEGKTISDTVLEAGERKIFKLVFHENFDLKLGPFTVTCYRSPEKEGQVLNLVRGNTMFMQGRSVRDEAGNLVRMLDIIRGTRLDTAIGRIDSDYEEYMANHAEDILRAFLKSVEAIILLHQHGFKHG
ncbi:MAG: hypothetical protein ABR512_14210, partial [Desulfopila sp.]